MACPITLELTGQIPEPSVMAQWASEVGAKVLSLGSRPRRQVPARDVHIWIWRRGNASFEMNAAREDSSDRVLLTFTADLSAWRWWNFPVMWLVGLFTAGSELQLQQDVKAVCLRHGAKQITGWDMPNP